MKTTIKLLTVVALALAIFGQHTTASAGGGGAFNFRGPSILASFSNNDPSGCIVTDVTVIASDAMVQDAPGSGSALSFASVTISQYDNCADLQLLLAYGSAPLTEGDISIAGNLNSATLNATVNVFDEPSETTFDVDISLAWIGTSALTHQHSNSHFRSPGCIMNSRSNDASRTAEVSGSISDGITNFTPAPSVEASIVSVKNGTVVVGCS